MENHRKIKGPIANDEVSYHLNKTLKAMKEQVGCEVKGGVFFILTHNKADGTDEWISVSNYKGEIYGDNLLYLYESVNNHIKEEFLSKPDDIPKGD
jgi:hypothetical protein